MEQETASGPVAGVIVLDKPRGPTSHQVTAWVRDMLGAPAGHSGTLDPQVSGVLVVMVGKAVRLAPLLLKQEKEYVCLMRLHGDVTGEELVSVAQEFTGRIYQRPPRRSAVRRALRIRTIHAIEIFDHCGRLVLFRVRCDAGTYIRSLCHHMGLALGVGAHMQELRRTRSGPAGEAEACTLFDLKDAAVRADQGDPADLACLIRPIESVLEGVPKVVVRDTAVDAIVHGAVLAGVGVLSADAFSKGAMVAVLTQKGELVCLGEALVASSAFRPGDTGLVIAPRTVFLERGAYPKGWQAARTGRR
ncbi:MAG: RNA-guided pseudouridylation complex pseudouridine synthase subunit Cbf5 [Methanomicrobiaceae archaeon]|nr:RNA-guided pseudouridylation complex pseudouridine synthase subunit Cbf5 [Methanomicrobiaceae archaeon]